jgi:hypothetical protein
VGRPSKFDDIDLDQVRELALEGKTDEEVAAKLEVSRSTLALWKTRHPEFSDALKAWKDQADDAVELSLYGKALTGDTTACIFWLKNRRSAQWRDITEQRREVKHSYDLTSVSDEDLGELERIVLASRSAVGDQSGEVPSKPH